MPAARKESNADLCRKRHIVMVSTRYGCCSHTQNTHALIYSIVNLIVMEFLIVKVLSSWGKQKRVSKAAKMKKWVANRAKYGTKKRFLTNSTQIFTRRKQKT